MNNQELKNFVFKIAKSQDKLAFSKIFDYFAPRIMGYLRASGTDSEISEEITQEVLSTVWQKAYQFNKNIANVSTWIFTIARNLRIDSMRKNKRPMINIDEVSGQIKLQSDPEHQTDRNHRQKNYTLCVDFVAFRTVQK